MLRKQQTENDEELTIMIYADNAATTKMSQTALETMIRHLNETYGNPSSLYTLGQKAKEVLEEARKTVAGVIGADPKEIYFTSGGSEADNQALLTAAALGKKAGKMHIISTAFEHHAILHALERLEKEGFEVTLLDVHEDGLVRPEELEAAIREDTCLVTVMYANNEIGTIQPIRRDRRDLPGKRRTFSHRCGAGRRPHPDQRKGRTNRHALRLRP